MDKRGANIDLVFRNGLKDFEVLPPAEVWENIQPVIVRNQRPYTILRAAALVAAIVSIGFFAYQWSIEVTGIDNSSSLAINPESEIPVFNNTVIRTVTLPQNAVSTPKVILASNIISAGQPVYNDLVLNDAATGISAINNQQAYSEVQNNRVRKTYISEPESTETKKQILEILNASDPSGLEIVKEKQRWSIAALASPAYYSKFSTGSNDLSQQILESEENVISYTGGVSFAFKVNKRLSIQSGLYYSSIGQIVGGISSFGGFQPYDNTKGDRNFEVLTSSGIIYTKNADVFLMGSGSVERISTSFTNDVFDPVKSNLSYLNNNLRQNLSYIEFPVLMRYKFIDKAIDLNLVGGISYNMLIKNSVSTMVNGEKYMVGKTDGVNPVSFSSSVGMGMEYSISDKLTLNLEPTFRYYMNPFSHVTGINVHPYSFGIFSGVSYKF
jgi:hypothetical protein